MKTFLFKKFRFLLPLAASAAATLFCATTSFARDDHYRGDWHRDWHGGWYHRGGVIVEGGFYDGPFYDPWYYDYDGPYYGYYGPPPRGVYTAHRYYSLPMDVQYALSRCGYYAGPIDGDIGPASRRAIRAYQRDHGLPVTGGIDEPLLRALRV